MSLQYERVADMFRECGGVEASEANEKSTAILILLDNIEYIVGEINKAIDEEEQEVEIDESYFDENDVIEEVLSDYGYEVILNDYSRTISWADA